MDKVCGAIGAMSGAILIGRPAVVAAGATAGLVAGALVGGPLGAAVGGVAGFLGGAALELTTRVGRLAGGMVGGHLGTAVGKAASALGMRPSAQLAEECKGFSLESLPGKLRNPMYTSHAKLSPEVSEKLAAQTQPGDVIITGDDADFRLELLMKVADKISTSGYGVSGDWTHIYMVDHGGTAMDILLGADGPERLPVAAAIADNTHAKILRPAYSSPEARDRVLKFMDKEFGNIKYDIFFNWFSDDQQYCLEYVGKAMQHEDPGLDMKTSTMLGFWPYMTADNFSGNPKLPEVASTGSNFWLNWLSHFT